VERPAVVKRYHAQVFPKFFNVSPVANTAILLD
jgi:hypothetical protein